ncbi:MAG: GNAT family N-acetyltransferase, partial [Oscillospiraceae bacterium]|nr:GNAT family N-acetyltransferase [Oscillospiraceae bacterium]
MDIRYAKPEDDLQALWQVCFQDDGAEFFASEYDPARALVTADGADAPAAMLHWLPQTLYVPGHGGAGGGEMQAAYILGVATRPEYRGRGFAGDLVEQALFELYLRGIPLAFLLPRGARIARFYEKFGFRQIGLRPVSGEMPPSPADERVLTEITPASADALDALYERLYAAAARPRRGGERWARIAAEYEPRFSGGR